MYASAPAKINLGLRILDKTPNGYHTISSIFLPITLVDIVEVNYAQVSTLHISGVPIPDSQDNIITKLLRELRANGQLTQQLIIHLHKQIPTGAGLGGGSSDLVTALELIEPFLAKPLDKSAKFAIANKMGSDCPFFLKKKPQLVSGTGHILEEVKMPNMDDYAILLIYPNLHIDTTKAYKAYDKQIEKQQNPSVSNQLSLVQALEKTVSEWKNHFTNDFESSVFDTYPQLAKIKRELYLSGAIYASMSGSGSTLYAFYKREHLHKPLIKAHFQQLFPEFTEWLFCWTDFYH